MSITMQTKAIRSWFRVPGTKKISPKLGEIEPKLVKITMRVMRPRLLFQSLSEVGLHLKTERVAEAARDAS